MSKNILVLDNLTSKYLITVAELVVHAIARGR